jgi:quercetin dioxygenase-like cupin family protein
MSATLSTTASEVIPGPANRWRHLGAPAGRVVAGVAAVVLVVALSGCGSTTEAGQRATPDAAAAASAEPVVRTRLGQTDPVNAPGQTLYLEEVRIAPGARLGTHFHEGTQVARVVSGRLTYNIVSGPATILRDTGNEVVVGPTVVTLGPGEGVIETPEVVHYGANDGTEPVVIFLAALLANGAPMATAVDGPAN